MEMIIFIGIPGSGKSSFYKENFFTTHLRINLDMLRTRNRERKLLQYCMDTSMPLVIDNTNVKKEDRAKYIQLGKAYRFRIKGYYFRADLALCLKRNRQRTGREKIPDKGLLAMYKQLEPPLPSEGFDALYEVQLTEKGFAVVL